uniref:Uncharacterized protein n=1 Tax=Oryza sativa subsp. japonica TaxID=39947 RepID=Q6YTN9_ORYSJ|nr:hypothetical protein [Oryza sativa Japonica Group]
MSYGYGVPIISTYRALPCRCRSRAAAKSHHHHCIAAARCSVATLSSCSRIPKLYITIAVYDGGQVPTGSSHRRCDATAIRQLEDEVAPCLLEQFKENMEFMRTMNDVFTWRFEGPYYMAMEQKVPDDGCVLHERTQCFSMLMLLVQMINTFT